jgi:mannonate dehydratase
MELVPSDNHGLEFCLGTWSEMGADIPEVIRYFGNRDELFYVHFRDVVGTAPSFHETWIDEGNYDALEAMETLRSVGFSGMMLPDHTPHVEGDTDWEHRGRAYTVGYMKALLRHLD